MNHPGGEIENQFSKEKSQSLNGIKKPQNRWLWGLALCSICLVVVVLQGPFVSGFSESEKVKNGDVSEVLPDVIPLGLSNDDFASLGPNWQNWANDLAKLIEELYTGEKVSPKRQYEIVAALKLKLEIIETALGDPAYAMIHDPLAEIHGKLNRRIMMVDSFLATLDHDPKDILSKRLDQSYVTLNEKLDDLENYLKKLHNGDKWIDYLSLKDLEHVIKSKKLEKNSLEVLSKTIVLVNPYEMSGERQKAFVQQPVFVEFSDAVLNYKTLLEMSVSTTLVVDQMKHLKRIAELLESYEESPNEEFTSDLRAELKVISSQLPDGGDNIWSMVQKNYMNYNFRVIASESFITRTGNKNIQECGPVCDCILGARVTGTQITDTNLVIDFKPSEDTAKFLFKLSGNTKSNTRGVTDQATVFTSGNHFFNVTRGVEYDGNKFSLEQGNIWVKANNHIYNARVNHRGLLTALLHLDDFALEKAREKKSESEAIAASRLRNKVFPRFNTELDDAFGKANKELDEKVFKPLRDLQLYPDALSFQTTENSLIINARLMGSAELAADRPSLVSPESDGATVYLHQSWMNNAIDRMNLAGRTMSQQEVRNEMEANFSKLLSREVKLKRQVPEDKEETKFIFASHDPLRFTINNGVFTIKLTTGLKRKGKDDIPIQIITIPLSFKPEGDKILVERGDVSIEPVNKPNSVTEQIATAGVMRNKIQEAIPSGELKQKFSFKSDEKEIPMEVSNLKLLNGWLILSVK